jgi:hypothetical protein
VKAEAWRTLDALRVDTAPREDRLVLWQEIFADDGDYAHVGKVARRQREVRRRASQDFFALAMGSLDRVERDGTYNQNCHIPLSVKICVMFVRA